MNTDFIGDVHGHQQLLEKLLTRLEYKLVKGVYMHPIQNTIFVGDIINRGGNVLKTLEIVHNMVEAGQAKCILGNHEINFLAYQINKKNQFLTEFQVKTIEKQIETTLRSFKGNQQKLNYYTDWIKTWPAFIEEENYRVVHACWLDDAIRFIKGDGNNNRLSDNLIIKLMDVKTMEYGLLHSLFQGLDIPLFTNQSNTKSMPVRIRWWDSMKGKTYRQMATKERGRIPQVPIPNHVQTSAFKYSKANPLLFIGHFCLDELPHLVSNNVCCLDFCVSKKGILTAYRLLAENKLKQEHLYFVHN